MSSQLLVSCSSPLIRARLISLIQSSSTFFALIDSVAQVAEVFSLPCTIMVLFCSRIMNLHSCIISCNIRSLSAIPISSPTSLVIISYFILVSCSKYFAICICVSIISIIPYLIAQLSIRSNSIKAVSAVLPKKLVRAGLDSDQSIYMYMYSILLLLSFFEKVYILTVTQL